MAQPWRDDDLSPHERAFMGEVIGAATKIRPRKRARPIGKIIDLPVLRPRQERVAKFVGKCVGIGAVYVIAGAIWAVRAVAWAARRVFMARRGPKEAS